MGIIVVGITAYATPTFAQQNPPTPSASTIPSTAEREFEFLKEQQESFRAFIQQERTELRGQQRDVIEEINTLLTALAWVVSIFTALFVGSISFFGYKSRKQVKEIVEERFEGQIASEVQKMGTRLKSQLEREIHSLGRKIVIIAPESDLQRFRSLELPAMQKRGFANISFQTDSTSITPETCDLVVYWYQSETDQPDAGLLRVVEHLKSFGNTLPLIVYTFHKAEKISGSDRTLLTSYPMSYLANLPLSLISNVFSIINALYPPQP